MVGFDQCFQRADQIGIVVCQRLAAGARPPLAARLVAPPAASAAPAAPASLAPFGPIAAHFLPRCQLRSALEAPHLLQTRFETSREGAGFQAAP